MRRNILLLILASLCATFQMAANDIDVVKRFGTNLSNWASGRSDYSAMQNIEDLCSRQNPAVRIADPIMRAMAAKYNVPKSSSYTLDDYIRCMQHEVDAGVSITFSDIKQIPDNLKPGNYVGVSYVSCNIRMSGASNLNEHDVFVLKNGKIAKIEEYVLVRDKGGRQKLKIDMSGFDIEDDETGYGFSYNYSKAFPISVSGYYTIWRFMIGADFGVNTDHDICTTESGYYNGPNDFSTTNGEYDLKYFFTATPGLYMKYFAIGCGFGVASFNATETTTQSVSLSSPGINTTVTQTTTTSDNAHLKFMMRPTLKGFIPCNDDLYISLAVNYDLIFGHKYKNGIGFSVGLHILLE